MFLPRSVLELFNFVSHILTMNVLATNCPGEAREQDLTQAGDHMTVICKMVYVTKGKVGGLKIGFN